MKPERPAISIAERYLLMSIDRARRELGYEPQHSWRNHVQPPA
jgi:nucleoside-diphosphate-sugar epimerase